MHNDNTDVKELNHFANLSKHWWDNEGPLKTLHDINPIRIEYIESFVKLKGARVCDVGCGGGILSEAMAKKGATVMGIDRESQAIDVANKHGEGLSVDYHCGSIEAWAEKQPQQYDVVTCLELLEHVPKPNLIIQACQTLVKPGGWCFFSTINRSLKAYTLAILGAEYVLGLLPKNTHDYNKFIRPSECCQMLRASDLELIDIKGLDYNPLFRTAELSTRVDVNYLIASRG